jgi:hypothetical protein
MSEPKPTALELWATDAAAFIKQAEDMGPKLRELSMVPRGGTPEERLATLVQLWEALAIPNGESNPLAARTAAFTQRVSVGHAAETHFRSLLGGLEGAVLEALKAGAQAASGHELILTAAWPLGTLLYFPGFRPVLVGGLIRFLPFDHAVRTALKPDEFYERNGGPTIVLGPANYADEKQPRGFYSLKSAVTLTKQMRKEQLDNWREKEKADEEARRKEELQRLRTPAGAIEQLQRQVAALRGETPPERYTPEELAADPMLQRARAAERFADSVRADEQNRTQQIVAAAVARATAVPVEAEGEPASPKDAG